MLFVIDGNNLLHTSDRWDSIPWTTRRLTLLEFIEKERLLGSPRNRATVVYDGHGPRTRRTGPVLIEAVFSGDQDADTVIRDLVGALKNARDTVVVTNDKSIRLSVRKKGAQVLSCEEFLALAKKKPSASRATTLDTTSVQEINDELERIWKLK
jgi:predicted RNA-binding protein with PIN domain